VQLHLDFTEGGSEDILGLNWHSTGLVAGFCSHSYTGCSVMENLLTVSCS
jgi:hypothetical protein